MMANLLTPAVTSVAQLHTVMKARMQPGVHFMFSTPIGVLKQKLNFEFPRGFVKHTVLTIVFQAESSKAMEIQYESTGHQNHYMYFRRLADGEMIIGTKNLVHKVHHRFDIKLKGNITMGRGVHIIRFQHKSDGMLGFTVDDNVEKVAEQVRCAEMITCSRVKHGVPFFDEPNSTDMMNFKVYELHHGCDDPKVMFEQISKNRGDNYTLPPFAFIGTGGEVIFSGKFHGRTVPTAKIPVLYGGKMAAALQGAPFDRQGWVVLKFYTTKITIAVVDSKRQAPLVISRFIRKADGSVDPNDKGLVRAISIGRNFQVNNVFVYGGMTLNPIQPRP